MLKKPCRKNINVVCLFVRLSSVKSSDGFSDDEEEKKEEEEGEYGPKAFVYQEEEQDEEEEEEEPVSGKEREVYLLGNED